MPLFGSEVFGFMVLYIIKGYETVEPKFIAVFSSKSIQLRKT